MALRNPFAEYDWMAGRNRRNFLGGKIEDPMASNQQRMLSQAGVYGPSEGIQTEPPEPATPQFDMGSWLRDLQEIYTTEGPAAKTYREHLGSMPQYKSPGGWGKFGSALVGAAEGLRSGGAAGFQAGQMAAEAPYRRELEQWGLKEQGLGRQAEMEDKQSNRRLQYMNAVRQVAKDESEYRKAMRDYDFKVWQEEANQAQDVATRNRWNRQDRETYTDPNGNIISYLPGDPNSVINMGPSKATTDISQENRRIGISEGQLGVSRGQLGVAQGQLGVSQGNLGLARERESRIASDPMAPTQQSSAMGSAISRASANNPEWSQFVNPETGTLIPPPARDSVKTQKYKEFQAEIARQYSGILNQPRYPRMIEY